MTPADAPRQNDQGDWVCRHGTAMDVHCCGCHSGFLFDAAVNFFAWEILFRE